MLSVVLGVREEERWPPEGRVADGSAELLQELIATLCLAVGGHRNVHFSATRILQRHAPERGIADRDVLLDTILSPTATLAPSWYTPPWAGVSPMSFESHGPSHKLRIVENEAPQGEDLGISGYHLGVLVAGGTMSAVG